MKYFFPALMAVAILFGLGLTFTPLLAEWLFPLRPQSYQQAPTTEARQAIADWFGVPVAEVVEAQAVRQRLVDGSRAWFSFSLAREPVQRFVVRSGLNQQELGASGLQGIFLVDAPPVAWWQPATLQRETYFRGESKRETLALLYNAELQQGYLVVNTKKQP